MSRRWILSFTFDVVECSACLVLTRDPDAGKADEEFVFTDVSNIAVERYHDVEPEVTLGDFTEIKKTPREQDRVVFQLDTGDALVTFEANADYDIKTTLDE